MDSSDQVLFMMLCTCFFPPHNYGCHLKALGPLSTDRCVPAYQGDNFCSINPCRPIDPGKTENLREQGVESCSLAISFRPVYSITEWGAKCCDLFIFSESRLMNLPSIAMGPLYLFLKIDFIMPS